MVGEDGLEFFYHALKPSWEVCKIGNVFVSPEVLKICYIYGTSLLLSVGVLLFFLLVLVLLVHLVHGHLFLLVVVLVDVVDQVFLAGRSVVKELLPLLDV